MDKERIAELKAAMDIWRNFTEKNKRYETLKIKPQQMLDLLDAMDILLEIISEKEVTP